MLRRIIYSLLHAVTDTGYTVYRRAPTYLKLYLTSINRVPNASIDGADGL
jgi:hypothetical protein